VGEISEASRQQTTGVSQINQAINEMDSGTQKLAANSEELAAAAASVVSETNRLGEAVAKLNYIVEGNKEPMRSKSAANDDSDDDIGSAPMLPVS
jgi:hypothetical protein